MRLATFFACFYLCILQVHAQSSGDIRTKQSGNWNTNSTWERFDGSTWVAALGPPSTSSGIITISAGHEINISGGTSVSADQLYIAGSLVVEANATLSLLNGAGDDLTLTNPNASLVVEGKVVRGNLTTIINPFGNAAISFLDGSIYNHKYVASFGDLPAAAWRRSSTVLVDAFSSSSLLEANATWNQVFGNIIFNNPSQRTTVNLAGFVKEVTGTFSVTNTNGKILQFSGADDLTLTIGTPEQGGDFIITGNSRIHISNAGTDTLNIFGDLVYTSSNATGSYFASTGTAVVNVHGNFNMATVATGKLMVGGSGTTGNTTLNIFGNFSLTGGQLFESGSGQTKGTIQFLKTGTSEFFNSGTISGFMNYYVAPACTLNLGTSPVVGSGSSRITVDGTLMLGSLDPLGAISAGTSNGNIRVPARTFNNGSSIIYNGPGKQFLSDSHPSAAGITTVIDNNNGVGFLKNISLTGKLVLEAGDLELNGFSFLSAGSVQRSNGRFAGGGNSSIQISGTGGGSWGEIVMNPASDTLQTLEINRTALGASATIVGPLKVRSALGLKAGEVNNAGDLWMVPNSTIYRYGEARITGSAINIEDGSFHVQYLSSSPSAGPSLSIETGIELPNDSSSLASLTISFKHAADELHLTKNVWVNGNFILAKGKFFQDGHTITMQGPYWQDDLGTFMAENGTVVFNSGSTSVDGSANPVFGNLSVTSSGGVYFKRSFTVQGDILLAPGSVWDMENFTLTLGGSATQLISANGATFSNISVVKTSSNGISLGSALSLTGTLQFTGSSKNLDFESNGFLILASLSDAPGALNTASIGRLANGNRVIGDVTVQRYISGEVAAYRYISSPVSGATVAQLKDDFPVQGNFLDPSPTQTICGTTAPANGISMYWYNETVPGGPNAGYVAYPAPGTTSSASPLVVGRGYSVFIRQCGAPTLIDYIGPVNQGTFNLPVTFTPNDPLGQGWNLVGNPFPSTIDWDLAGWTKNRISPIIAITDNAAGMTRYYEAGVTTDQIPNGYIASGQGFFVRANGANPVLTIRETVKTNSVGEYYRERSNFIPSLVVSLSDGKNTDWTYVKTIPNALAGLDSMDAPKILNPNFSLSTLSADNHAMAINALKELSCGAPLALKTEGLTVGEYSIALDTRQFFNNHSFVLIDKFEGKQISIKDNQYSFKVTEDSLSFAADRFMIMVDQAIPAGTLAVSVPEVLCDDVNKVSLSSTVETGLYSIWTKAGRRLTEDFRGSGSALVIPVLADSLQNGANELNVHVNYGCSAMPVAGFSVVKSLVPAFEVSSQLNCAAGTNLLIAEGGTNTSFLWYTKSEGGKPIHEGSEFETPVLDKNDIYFVSAKDNLSGCVTDRVSVTATPPPASEVAIQVEGVQLTSSSDQGNQWFFNGALLEGETGKAISMTQPGLYELFVNNGGCTISASYMLEEGQLPGIQVYPNPFADRLQIEGIDDEVKRIDLTNTVGQSLGTIYRKGQKFDGEISLGSMPDGLYLLIVEKGDRKYSYRLFKKAK